MNYSKLGSNIKKRRLQLDMSQEKLAELAGISVSFAGQIERAERKLSLETLVSIANALNVSVDYLLTTAAANKQDERYISEIQAMLLKKSPHARETAYELLNTLFEHIK